MNLDLLKSIIKVAKDEGVCDLKLETKEFKVGVTFQTGAMLEQPIYQRAIHTTVQTTSSAQSASTNPQKEQYHVIKSPFVGTFYSSPAPGKPIFAKVGDKVRKGQTLCILEAMKIMNEIEADVAGEVVEVCVDNESLVEFGQVLFKIKPA